MPKAAASGLESVLNSIQPGTRMLARVGHLEDRDEADEQHGDGLEAEQALEVRLVSGMLATR